MGKAVGKKHALFIPVCLQAHFFGMYRHAVELAKRGVTVSFCGLEREIALLRTFEELQGLNFNLLSYQDFRSENYVPTGDLLFDLFKFCATAKSRFQPIFDKLMADQKAGLPGPTCIIGDRFLVWALDLAKELNIPYYQFWSCGATYPRALQAFVPLLADGTLTYKTGPRGEKYIAKFEGCMKIPGLPAFEHREMISPPPTDIWGISSENDLAIGVTVGKADGLIVNSFYDLEAPQIDAIQQFWKENPHGKIPGLYLVGPVSVAATFKDRSLQTDLESQGDTCLQWLDNRPPQSVVFIAIGSIARIFPHQIKELSLALEASEQGFLWVISKSDKEHLPPDFAARNREKGLIVSGWVPQLQILQHTSIGGFMTHCGWNSIIESITSGVPMAAWPQLSNDQFINCRYLVDVLKVAVEVRSDNYGWVPVTLATTTFKEDMGFEKAVRQLMSQEGNELRVRVRELQKKAEAAVADGGASTKALSDLVESIPS